MTLQQFLQKLERTPCNWTIEANGGAIRTVAVPGLNWVSCPISVFQWAAAEHVIYVAVGIGLSKRTTVRIIHAADWKTTPHKRLRARLLKACGLS